MKKITLVLIAALLTQVGCKKDEATEIDLPVEQIKMNPVGAVLKSVEWKTNDPSYDAYENYSYNTDGTLKQAVLGNNQTSYTKDLIYSNGLLKRLVRRDLTVYDYEHSANKQLISITRFPYVGANYGSKFEFEYSANGALKVLNYFEFDDASKFKKLIYATVYEYDAQNLVTKIISTSISNSYKYIYLLENYSDECQFSPWPFVTELIIPDFQFYNISLLSRLNKLPKKITRTVYDSNNQQKEVDVQNVDYTIVNKQLEKVIYLNKGLEVDFKY